MGELIGIAEYARRRGLNQRSTRQKAREGGFKTVRKIGGIYVIDEDEEPVDHRIKSGKYIKKGITDEVAEEEEQS